MNDFLQSLRNGNNKRFDGTNRRPYNNHNRGNERQKGNAPLQRTISKEYWPVLKQALEDITTQQKRNADADERRAQAEERKADALETIAKYVMHLIAPDAAIGVENDLDLPVETIEAVVNTEDTLETAKLELSANADQERVLGIIHDMREDKVSYVKIAAYLTAEGIPTISGKGKWSGSVISRLYQQNS